MRLRPVVAAFSRPHPTYQFGKPSQITSHVGLAALQAFRQWASESHDDHACAMVNCDWSVNINQSILEH